MAQALPVLILDKKSFKIDTEAFKSVLAKVGNRPFALISINGPTRTGKSYILSHFVRYFESKKKDLKNTNWFDNKCPGFTWRGGIERTTTGMDLWSEPYFVKTSEGEEIAVLLIDTQGLFDPETSAQQNAIIFSMSTLCSSVMIFNIKCMIDENILQQLDFFSGYAHMASVHQNQDPNEKVDEDSLKSNRSHGTNMLFLLRDFEEDFEFGLHNSNSPLENEDNLFIKIFNLESRQNCPDENKVVRQNILRNFQDVSVYCLPDPGKKFKRLNNSAPDDDFKENVVAFVEHMVRSENLVKKTVLNVPTTGVVFQKYIDMWASMCKDTQKIFPDVLTVAENTSFTQYTIAFTLAVSKYKSDMDGFVKANLGSIFPGQLEELHLKLVNAAEEIFLNAKIMSNPKFENKFKQDLAENIERCYQFAKESNDMYKEIVAINKKSEEALEQKMKEMKFQMEQEQRRLRADNEIAQAQAKLEMERRLLREREAFINENENIRAQAKRVMDRRIEDERYNMDRIVRGFQDSQNLKLSEMTNQLKFQAEEHAKERQKAMDESSKLMNQLASFVLLRDKTTRKEKEGRGRKKEESGSSTQH